MNTQAVSHSHHGQRPAFGNDQVILLVQFPDRQCDSGHSLDWNDHYAVYIPVQPDPADGLGPDEVGQVLVLIQADLQHSDQWQEAAGLPQHKT